MSRYRRFQATLIVFAFSAIAASAALSQEWPQEVTTPDADITMYEPQIQSFDGDNVKASAAVAIQTPEMSSPVYGAVWIDARVSTDRQARTATLLDAEVPDVKFPESTENQGQLAAILEREIPAWDLTMSLDALTASVDASKMEQEESAKLGDAPPRIIFATYPAVLVTIDGDPQLEPVENSDMQYVVNTPFFIVYNPSDRAYYLKGGSRWYQSFDVESGWRVTEFPPDEVVNLAETSSQYTEAVDSSLAGTDIVPTVMVSTEPAELIVSDGAPQYAPIEGTNLLYMTNTESDVIMDIDSQDYYVLLSGRWYTSGNMTSGRWSYVDPDRLPDDFARIPADSDIGDVLASVPGTPQARDAVLEQAIPQTAEVDRSTATASVTYDGDPDFERAEGTDVSYAVNTDIPVLLIDGRYYCCDDAVWFVSDFPVGPWSVCVSLPVALYGLPPSCPFYNVKYCHIYGYTPDVVYVGYTPGYTWSFIHNGCVVYGTGYRYHGWYRRHYFPRPYTFGFGACYSPYTGWGFSFGFSYGWLGIGWYRPYYSYWWGPSGYRLSYRHGFTRTRHHTFDHGRFAFAHPGFRAPYFEHTRERFESPNVYRYRANGVERTGHFLAGVPRPSRGRVVTEGRERMEGRQQVERRGRNEAPPEVKRRTSRETGGSTHEQSVSRTRNNVFTDENGNVYRRTTQGWEMRNQNRWMPTERSTNPNVSRSYRQSRPELERQYESRQRENARTNQFQTYQNTQRTRAGAPSYQRPSTTRGSSGSRGGERPSRESSRGRHR